MAQSGKRWRFLLAVPCAAALAWGVWSWRTDDRYKSAMEQIESAVMAERYATACRDLEQLLTWKTDPSGGIVYLLGSCELRGANPGG